MHYFQIITMLGAEERKGVELTFVKFRDWGFSLFCILQLCVLLVSIVSFYMVPGIELEDVIFLTQKTRAKLKWISPFEALLRIVGSMWWDLGISRSR